MANTINIVGNLTANPEVVPGANGKSFTRFCVAVRRTFKNKDGNYDTDFFNCTANGGLGESVAKNMVKGQRIAVTGEMRSRKKDGVTYWDVAADKVTFEGPRPGGNGGNGGTANAGGGDYADDYEDYGL